MATNEIVSYEQAGNNKWVFTKRGRKWILPDEWRKENYVWMKNKWEWNKRVVPKFWSVEKQGTENETNGTFYFLKMPFLVYVPAIKLPTVDIF